MQDGSAAASTIGPREWGLAAMLAVAFAPAVFGMAEVWRNVDYQSHGFLVPVVSLWVLLRERYGWRRLETAPDRRGLFVLGVALAAYLVGLGLGSVPLQGTSLVAAIAGAVLYARGSGWLAYTAFPVAYLIFMVPVPTSWITPLIVRLQLFVSEVSVALLQGMGIAIVREGNVLELPGGVSLFVAEACSGVTSVITLVPLAVVLAYLTLRERWTRVLLVLSVIPLAMLGNLTRVLVTVLGTIEYGAENAVEGPVHELAGLSTYLVACGLMLAVGAGLRALEPRAERPS